MLEDCLDPTAADGQDTGPPCTFNAMVQEIAEISVNMKVVQLQMRSLLRPTGEDLHTVSLDWWIRLTQSESFTLPRIRHHEFFKLYILIVLSFSQRCLLFVSLGFKEVVS